MTQLAELNRNELQVNQQGGSLAEADLNHQEGIDVWGILSRRKWIVIFFMLLGLGLGYIYLLQASPVYESVAQLFVEHRRPPTLTMDSIVGGMNFQSDEARHAHMLTSAVVLSETYARPDIKKLKNTFPDESKALLGFSESLSVDLVEEGTNLLNLSFRGPNPDETEKVLVALIGTYREFLKKTYRKEGQQSTETLISFSQKISDDLAEATKERRELQQGDGAVLLWQDDQATNVHQARQANYERNRTKLQEEKALVVARLQQVMEAANNNQLDVIELMAQQDGSRLVEQDNSYRDAQLMDRWMGLEMQELALKNRGYAEDHPDMITLQEQKKVFMKQTPDIVEGRASRRSSMDLEERVQAYATTLQKRAQEIDTQIQQMEQLYSEEQLEAKKIQAVQIREEELRRRIERLTQTYEATISKLAEASVLVDHEGFTFRETAKPGIGEKVAPKAIVIMPVAAMLGGLFGFGLGYLVDIADKAFRTPDEVSQIMRLPVVGHIPLIDTSKQKLLPDCTVQPVICTVHRPKSPQSESYRAVRTALYFNNRDANHQVIQMTSPMPGDGKSTLAANLAVTIAQSGKKVLLMDADFRRPTLHKVFGIKKQSQGLATIVSGETEPLDAMQYIPQCPNLSLLVCGARPANPSELLSSEAFSATLDIFRQEYDYVMIDTPPVLAVSDPCAVAARADGVILTFRIHKRARPLAVRARDALTNIGANVIGVVVNGVDQEAGGYYSQYRYGYSGYRYAYNYRYGYGYGAYGSEKSETKAIKGYFDDDAAGAGVGEAATAEAETMVDQQQAT